MWRVAKSEATHQVPQASQPATLKWPSPPTIAPEISRSFWRSSQDQSGELRPNLDRLTVGVDLGDQWSHYCILGLEGERLTEGQLRTTQQHIAEFFQALNAARVVFEVGTHSAWVQEVICKARTQSHVS